MKKLLLFFLFITSISFAQEDHAWIYFKDKPNVEAALNDPITILSEKSIARKELRNTPIDERDVPVNEDYISRIKTQEGIKVKAKSKWLNCIHVLGSKENISKLERLDFVSGIEFASDRNSGRSKLGPSPAKGKLDIATNYNYGGATLQTEMLNTNYLHENNFLGEGITIAVLDSGFPNAETTNGFYHLVDYLNLLGGYDFPNRSEDFNNPGLDSHGYIVLSTMAGFIEDVFVGTAPDASYYLFRTEVVDSETPVEESYWVEAAERADSLGVDIINTSLNYTLFDDSRYNYAPEDMDGETAFISRGANIATEKGILVVVSAGNSGEEEYFQRIGAPADANVLTVGAVQKNRLYAYFSSVGPTEDGRIKPDVAALGLDAIAIDNYSRILPFSGTSLSAPIITGSIASFWQADPSLTNLEVMDLVRASASQFENPDYKIGYGIPDFEKALNALVDRNEFNPEVDELLIQQNPVMDQLKFYNPTNSTYDITMFNTSGQVILKKKNAVQEIDLSGFSRGVYIAMFEQNNSRQSFLIIKK